MTAQIVQFRSRKQLAIDLANEAQGMENRFIHCFENFQTKEHIASEQAFLKKVQAFLGQEVNLNETLQSHRTVDVYKIVQEYLRA